MGGEIRLNTDLKFLGLRFDKKVTFMEHVKQTAAKTRRIITSKLAHVEARGPSEGKCKLLMHVVILVLLNGAPIYADTIDSMEY